MKIHLVINPSSGKESGKRSGEAVADRLAERGHRVKSTSTEKKGDATRDALAAAESGADLVIACGGDGTVNEVVHGLVEAERKPLLAIFAQGTVNDFATQLQIPKDPDAFVAMIEKGHSTLLDVGQMNEEYFLNVASFGPVSEIGHQVDIQAKSMLGRLAYVMEGIRVAPDIINTPTPMRITMDTGEVAEGDFLFAGITNSPSVGGFSQFAPKAVINDGLLDLVVIRRTDLMTLGQILISLRSGEHLSLEQIVYYQAKKFEITAENETAVDIDGEEAGKLPATVRVLPSVLTCIIP